MGASLQNFCPAVLLSPAAAAAAVAAAAAASGLEAEAAPGALEPAWTPLPPGLLVGGARENRENW